MQKCTCVGVRIERLPMHMMLLITPGPGNFGDICMQMRRDTGHGNSSPEVHDLESTCIFAEYPANLVLRSNEMNSKQLPPQ